jgi:hypothetical protein
LFHPDRFGDAPRSRKPVASDIMKRFGHRAFHPNCSSVCKNGFGSSLGDFGYDLLIVGGRTVVGDEDR